MVLMRRKLCILVRASPSKVVTPKEKAPPDESDFCRVFKHREV
jgi:hypothetical protein